MPQRFRYIALGIILFLLGLWYHHDHPLFTIENRLYADEAGYYAWLPATFIYDWDARAFPPDVDKATGYGFLLRGEKVVTKYPFGVALAEAPFFFAAHAWCRMTGMQPDGFSAPYFLMMGLASVVYACIGLWLLGAFLKRYHTGTLSIFIFLLLGTNLLYYIIVRPGYAHVYSFFWLSFLLWAFGKFLDLGNARFRWLTLLALCGLISTRYLHIIFIPLLLMIDVPSWPALKQRVRLLLQRRWWLTLAGMLLVTAIPQLCYNHYLSGSFFAMPYAGEGFTHRFAPYFATLWFSPNNGLFVYCPLLLLGLLGTPFLFTSRRHLIIPGLTYFFLLSYIYASWHIPTLGAGYSGRWVIDILPLIALIMVAVKQATNQWNFAGRTLILVVVIATLIFSQKMLWSSPRWFGESTWDWKTYTYTMGKGLPPEWFHEVQEFSDDYETPSGFRLNAERILQEDGSHFTFVSDSSIYSAGFAIPWDSIRIRSPRRFEVSARIKSPALPVAMSLVVSQFGSPDGTGGLFMQSAGIGKDVLLPGYWTPVRYVFTAYTPLRPSDELRVYLYNPSRQIALMDDLLIKIY